MRKLLLPLLLMMAAMTAFGAPCTDFTNLGALIGAGTCTFGPLTFTNWTYTPGGTNPPASAGAIGASFIESGALVQVEFNPGFSVTAGQSSDVKIGYTALGGVQGLLLAFSAESHTGGAVNSVTENYWLGCNSITPALSCGAVSGTLVISTSNNPGPVSAFFANTNAITVSKDILADATQATGQGELAHISGVVNGLVVPEPMTLSLMGLGLLAIGFAGRRIRK